MPITSVDIPISKWTLVCENEKQFRIKITLEDPSKYYYAIVPTGGVFPIDPKVVGTLFIGSEMNVQYREFIDVYMIAFVHPGRIECNTDQPFQDVFIQNQTTPSVIVNFNQIHNSTTLLSEALINQRDIVVTSATGIVVGSYIILFNTTTERFYFGRATVISGAPTITLDTPLDSTFPAGTFVDIAITDLSVNGLTTPQPFGLRGTGSPPGIDVKVDITRILFTCVASSPVSLSLFANLTALLNGLVLRRRDTTNNNIFNVKSNREMAGMMFDFDVSAAINPAQGEDGFKTRFTISRTGVATRLPVGDDLELIVQDNLLGITILECIAEGHIVE